MCKETCSVAFLLFNLVEVVVQYNSSIKSIIKSYSLYKRKKKLFRFSVCVQMCTDMVKSHQSKFLK